MTLDPGVFKNEWTVLCERFGREPSSLVAKRYYAWLKERLSTEQFVAGTRRIFAEREFFPRPVDFMPPGGSVEVAATEAWEAVVPLLRNTRLGTGALSEPARRAVQVMGGLERIGASVGDLPFRRREFMEFYRQFADAALRDSLPPMTEAGRTLIQRALKGELTL